VSSGPRWSPSTWWPWSRAGVRHGRRRHEAARAVGAARRGEQREPGGAWSRWRRRAAAHRRQAWGGGCWRPDAGHHGREHLHQTGAASPCRAHRPQCGLLLLLRDGQRGAGPGAWRAPAACRGSVMSTSNDCGCGCRGTCGCSGATTAALLATPPASLSGGGVPGGASDLSICTGWWEFLYNGYLADTGTWPVGSPASACAPGGPLPDADDDTSTVSTPSRSTDDDALLDPKDEPMDASHPEEAPVACSVPTHRRSGPQALELTTPVLRACEPGRLGRDRRLLGPPLPDGNLGGCRQCRGFTWVPWWRW